MADEKKDVAELDSIPADVFETLPTTPVIAQVSAPKDVKSISKSKDDLPDSIPADEFISDEEKYSSTEQQIKTGLEGLAKGAVGSTIATGIETQLLGVKPEDIVGRAEENPVTSGLGQAVGLAGGLLSGTGAGGVMLKAGEAAAGLTAAGKALQAGKAAYEAMPLAAKIGTSAVREATEMAILASDDELAKKIWINPEETAEQAISNIGLAAALGGAGGAFITGAVSPLWKATMGPKVEGFLSTLTSKMGGKDVEQSTAHSLFERAGIDPGLAPSVLAKIDGDPTAEQLFSKLSQTDTTHFGRKVQDELDLVTKEVGNKMAETLGRDKTYIDGLESKLDKYTRGNDLAVTLHKELDDVIKPINEAYEATNNQFKLSPISMESKRIAADDIAKKAIEQGWYKSADDASKNLMEKVLKKLPEQETAEDLKLFITNLRESNPFGSPTYATARDLSNVLKDAQERAIMQGIQMRSANNLTDAYHGTFNDFAPSEIIPSKGGHLGSGIYLNTDKATVSNYGDRILGYKIDPNKLADFSDTLSPKVKAFAEKYGYSLDKLEKKHGKDVWLDMAAQTRRLFPEEDLVGAAAGEKLNAMLKSDGFEGIKYFHNDSPNNIVFFDKAKLLSPNSNNTEIAGKAAIEAYTALKSEYKQLMDTLDNLNEHLHVGKYYGPKSFLDNLKEMGTINAEGVLNRLSGTSKADTLNVLSNFPQAFETVKAYHIDNLLNSSKGIDGNIDPRKFMRQFDKLSPQLKELVAGKEAQDQLQALTQIVQKTSDDTHNWSNTARTIDKLTNGMPSPITMVAAALGHGLGAIVAHVGSLGFKEGGDAFRYSLLKFLGSDQPIKSEAFKSMVQYMSATIKGEASLNKAVESVFKTGILHVSTKDPSQRDLDKLDKQVSKALEDQDTEVSKRLVDSETGYYMPEHQTAIAASTMKALDYLKTIKPKEAPTNNLDSPIPPSKAEVARYNRALTIAQNPNVILKRIKDGTLQMSDIKDISSMYPSLYTQMQKKLMDQVINRKANDEPVPYKTKLSLSLFVQQPLDGTMTPEAIMAAQPKQSAAMPPQQGQMQKPKKSTSKLGKNNASYRTADQEAESDRSARS